MCCRGEHAVAVTGVLLSAQSDKPTQRAKVLIETLLPLFYQIIALYALSKRATMEKNNGERSGETSRLRKALLA